MAAACSTPDLSNKLAMSLARWTGVRGTFGCTSLVKRHLMNQQMKRLLVVASSPPAEATAVRSEPLTKVDLVNHLASGCKPKSKWRIGSEHEKFGFNFSTLKPLTYNQIAGLLEGLSERFNWEKEMEGDNIIGLKQSGQSISLEPGGQLELSGAPVETLHETSAEVDSHLHQVKVVAEELGIGFVGIAYQPKWPNEAIPLMPKARYHIMRNYFPKVGTFGLDVMFRTCTVQVNLDFSSEEDMVKKLRVGLALQPVATAIFANSPFKEGAPNGHLSYRSHMYEDLDNDRTGILPFVFHDDFGFEKYVEYALEVPMYFVYRDKQYIDCTGLSFRDFLHGKLPKLPGEVATITDWENHLNTIYSEVRLKKYLEMRGADVGPRKRICALPALWVGLLYDDESLEAAYSLIQTEAERAMLRSKVPKMGLKTPFRDGLLKNVAQQVLKLAKEGLQRRGHGEEGFLDDISEIVETGVTSAEKLLHLYNERWQGSVDPVFQELLY